MNRLEDFDLNFWKTFLSSCVLAVFDFEVKNLCLIFFMFHT